MPYKTKAAKIAASARRISFIETAKDGSFSYQNSAGIKPARNDREKLNSINDKLYIRNDLMKSGAASAIIITVQLWLSLTPF